MIDIENKILVIFDPIKWSSGGDKKEEKSVLWLNIYILLAVQCFVLQKLSEVMLKIIILILQVPQTHRHNDLTR